MVERRVSGAKVIKSYLNPNLSEFVQQMPDSGRILENIALGDLDLQKLWFDIVTLKDIGDVTG